jgi:glycosyltransferase involved in cell wall biosynthesis
MSEIDLSKLKIAIVHDWITNHGGAENVLLVLHDLFPDAPVFTSVYNQRKMAHFKGIDIRTSFLQKFPLAKSKHRWFLNFMPMAFESFDLKNYDIVISSSHSCAKGVITKMETMHVCYCYTPMRYAWDESQEYIKNSNFPLLLKKWYIPKTMNKIRIWDRLAADRVDYFIAISDYIRKRIKKYYRQDSVVIYPPVDTSKFSISFEKKNYYLAVGRLIPYKRFDLIIETFNKNGLPLKIIGIGPEYNKLKQIAKPNINFPGYIPNNILPTIYNRAQALIFPQSEDFGIIPIEAMACGIPVIAYKAGAAKETVVDGITGIFFEEQSVQCLSNTIERFSKMMFDPQKIRENALRFDIEEFKKQILFFIKEKSAEWQKIVL